MNTSNHESPYPKISQRRIRLLPFWAMIVLSNSAVSWKTYVQVFYEIMQWGKRKHDPTVFAQVYKFAQKEGSRGWT